ncbi:MAG: biopolymer transporter ExbD [Candidatus Eisenbacteria bacterium]|nr:biopolymer transporter ExbD [Candidatus Eisenbacteria bacterium]
MSRFRRASANGDEPVFSDINITPFTDVVLVLLIIFLVTAPMLFETRIPVKLPVSSQASASPEAHPTVVVTADGQVFLDDRPVDGPAALVGALRNAILTRGDKTVVFKADAEARHGRVIECLDAAKAAGADRLAISARQARREPSQGR